MLRLIFTGCLIGGGWIGLASPVYSQDTSTTTYADIRWVGAMKNVMQKGDLSACIDLDTLQPRTGLYGVGPLDRLSGELLIRNGQVYTARCYTDTAMQVVKTFRASAPFFVYGYVTNWRPVELPDSIQTLRDLQDYLEEWSTGRKRPFLFKLQGQIKQAQIHVQNLPSGSKISTPEDAHRSQLHFTLTNQEAEIIGFFSTTHQGIFTHHDSFLHLHLISGDERMMGHLDSVSLGSVILYLPID